jgi:3-dehydroquinate synthase
MVEGGEHVKNDPGAVAALQARLDALRVDRQSHVVIVGGGALLDMAGYVAGVVHRGIRVTRVPTTVLAQGDSGVGVKNGVNAFGKKNFLGTFAPPFAVINDRRFLETLGRRDTVAGMAEAVKVALIRDADFFAWLTAHADALAACEADPLHHLVRRGAELHLEHIATSGDPFEMGSARPLDFGHWAAHKLESLTRNRLRHGEAVAIGVALDTVYSVRTGLLAPAALEPILTLLERLGLRLWDDALDLGPAKRPTVLDGLEEFREHLGGELTVTLLREIGRGVEVHEMREDAILNALAELRLRDAGR